MATSARPRATVTALISLAQAGRSGSAASIARRTGLRSAGSFWPPRIVSRRGDDEDKPTIHCGERGRGGEAARLSRLLPRLLFNGERPTMTACATSNLRRDQD